MSLEILKKKLNALTGFTGSSTPASIKPTAPIRTTSSSTPSSSLTQSLNSLPGSTISKAPPPTRFERFKSLFPEEMREDIFGTGAMVRAGDPIIPGVVAPKQRFDTGALGFLYGGLTKSDMQRYEERRQKLIDGGISQERAAKVAEMSLSSEPLNINAKEERIIRNAKLWDITESALDSLDFIPGLGAVIGQTGDVTKQIIKGFAKTQDVAAIEKSLIKDFNMIAKDAKRLAPEIAKSESPVVIASKIDETVRGSQKAREQAGKLTEDLKTRLSSITTPTPSKAPPELKGGYFRSMQGGTRFEEIPENAVAPAPIREGLDTFVTKADEGFVVIEGRTGKQVGDPGKTMQEAIRSAKESVETIGENMARFLDESKLSPRYTHGKSTSGSFTPQQKGMYDDALARAKEQGAEITPEGNIVLYHGTDKARAPKEGEDWRISSYFTTDEKTARQFANQGEGSEPIVMRVEIPPQKVFAGKSKDAYWSLNEPTPVKLYTPPTSKQTKARALEIREKLMRPESSTVQMVKRGDGELVRITDKKTGKAQEVVVVSKKEDGSLVTTRKDTFFPTKTSPDRFEIEYLGNKAKIPDGGITFGELERFEKLEEARKVKGVTTADKLPIPAERALLEEAKKHPTPEDFIKAQGEPLFHGSPNAAKIEKEGFSTAFAGKRSKNAAEDVGIHFTDSRKTASAYSNEYMRDIYANYEKRTGKKHPEADSLKDSGTVEAFLDMKNPMYVEQSKMINRVTIQRARAEGYDGIIAKNGSLPDSGREYVVFDPSQIKTRAQLEEIWKKANPTPRKNMKLSAMSRSASSYEKFVERTGITEEALDATVRKQGFKDAREYYAKNGPEKIAPDEARSFDEATPERPKGKEEALSEEEAYARMAEQYEGSDFVVRSKARASEQIADNLRSVFADMRQLDLNDPKLKFTDEDLYQAQMQYEFAKESLLDHPGRPLARFVSKKEGQFLDLKDPAKAKTQAERARIEDRNRKVLQTAEKALEGTKYSETFDDPDTLREVIEDFMKKREALKDITDNLQEIRNGIRTAKALDNFVGENQAKLARELARNQKALANLAKASERAGFQRGFKAGAKKYEALVNRLRERRQRINGLKWAYDLSDTEFEKIRRQPRMTSKGERVFADADPRFMEKAEFESYMSDLEKRAQDAQTRRTERTIIRAIIKEKNLKNTENLREAMGFPPLEDMSMDQLKRFDSMLSKLEESDVVLSKRTLEVIDRTVLKGAKTVRQVRDFLAKELKRTLGMDVNLSDLENLTANRLDGYLWDSALAEKQPFYGFLVHRTHKHMLEGEANFLRIQKRFEQLVRDANKSRRRTFLQKVKQQFVPTKPEIIRYLEARGEEKELFAKGLTKEELALAEYMRTYYNNAYNYLSYINEIRGARYIDAYFTHVRKGFLEKWTDDGFVAALKNIWDQNKEDLAIANIIDKDTGQILPKSKFFQYTLRRTGEGEVSQNVTRVFLKYAKLLERKKMLDKMVPELDVYTRSLTPQDMTPRGLQMNRKMHEFVNEFLNNKRGRREPFLRIEQNSIPDMLIRGGNMMVSMLDLGANFLSGSAAMVGEQLANYALLGKMGTIVGFKRRVWDTGMRRFLDPNASKILKEAEPFIGRNIWTELAEADMPVFERVTKAMFGLFGQSSVEANKIYLLANLTPEELKAGKISAERLAAMRLDAGRWRDMGKDVKSIVGSTSPGAAFTKYKGWAIPIMRTTANNYKDLAVKLAKGDLKGAVKSREAKEIVRQAETVGVALYLASVIAGHDDDEGPVAKLKARVIQESMTLLGGLDPRFFLASPRIVSWLTQLSNNLIMLAKLEEYKTDSKYGDKGDLKGWGGLKRQFTPGFIRQFLPNEPEKTVPAGTGTGVLPGNPALQNLNRLQNLQRSNVIPAQNPAIQNLRKLQERMRNSVRP